MMEIFDKFKEKKEVKRPNLIVFEKENELRRIFHKKHINSLQEGIRKYWG